MGLIICMVVKYQGGMIWKFDMSIYVNDMEKGTSSELSC
jgi:hypothetical protein